MGTVYNLVFPAVQCVPVYRQRDRVPEYHYLSERFASNPDEGIFNTHACRGSPFNSVSNRRCLKKMRRQCGEAGGMILAVFLGGLVLLFILGFRVPYAIGIVSFVVLLIQRGW